MVKYFEKRILTYKATGRNGRTTQGGYSSAMVVHQKFVVRIPDKLDPEQAAPLLSAGVTSYRPLKQSVGIVSYQSRNFGLRWGWPCRCANCKGNGASVIFSSSSDKKREEALKHLGADVFLVSSIATEMEKAASTLDYNVDTVPVVHPLESYLSLLKFEGTLIVIGSAPKPLQVI